MDNCNLFSSAPSLITVIFVCYFCKKDIPKNEVKRCSCGYCFCSKKCQNDAWKGYKSFMLKSHKEEHKDFEEKQKNSGTIFEIVINGKCRDPKNLISVLNNTKICSISLESKMMSFLDTNLTSYITQQYGQLQISEFNSVVYHFLSNICPEKPFSEITRVGQKGGPLNLHKFNCNDNYTFPHNKFTIYCPRVWILYLKCTEDRKTVNYMKFEECVDVICDTGNATNSTVVNAKSGFFDNNPFEESTFTGIGGNDDCKIYNDRLFIVKIGSLWFFAKDNISVSKKDDKQFDNKSVILSGNLLNILQDMNIVWFYVKE